MHPNNGFEGLKIECLHPNTGCWGLGMKHQALTFPQTTQRKLEFALLVIIEALLGLQIVSERKQIYIKQLEISVGFCVCHPVLFVQWVPLLVALVKWGSSFPLMTVII